jgi:replicative DNA helicase
MIELQIISYILKTKSLEFYRKNDLTLDYFPQYQFEMKFILDHNKEYGNVPDLETFIEKFEDFEPVNVTESESYLYDTIHEQFVYENTKDFLQRAAEILTSDSTKAVEFLRANTDTINRLIAKKSSVTDIAKESLSRLSTYEERRKLEGVLGIPTTLEEFDKITKGWMAEDLVIILGRSNEGKTWVLLYFLVMAWKLGHTVLLYSGEMSELLVGFRFDTLNENFSNEGLMNGDENLGKDKTANDYEKYIKNLSSSKNPFYVLTPKMLGGRRLDIPTLHKYIEELKPSIVGIDQISLMEDYRAQRGDVNRIRYTHIAEDLFLTSEKYQIPVIAPAQANRDSMKENKSGDQAPEAHHISEADGILHNATRVISIKQIDLTMKLAIKKNRYGKNNQEVIVIWDIDNGVVKPFMATSTPTKNQDTDKVVQTQDEHGLVYDTLDGIDLF